MVDDQFRALMLKIGDTYDTMADRAEKLQQSSKPTALDILVNNAGIRPRGIWTFWSMMSVREFARN